MIYYFIKEGNTESGPFTFEQLKSKSIHKDTQVWHAGLKDWTTASNTFGLRELFKKKLSIPAFAKSKLKKLLERKKLKSVPKKLDRLTHQ